MTVPQGIAHGQGSHVMVEVGGLLLAVEGVVPLANAVAGEDAAFNAGGLPLDLTQVGFHLVIGDGVTGEELASLGDVGVVHQRWG